MSDNKDIKDMITFSTADDQPVRHDKLMDSDRHYELYVTQVDDYNALVQVDLALREIAPVPAYYWLLGIQVEIQDPGEDGFYQAHERDALLSLEKEIVEQMENEGHARFVGSVTYAGTRMMYFYGQDENYLPPIVGGLAAKHSDYEFNFMTEKDGPWRFFFNSLFPSDMDLMHIRNRHMLANLEAAGLDMTATYAVSYYFYFQDGAARAQAAARFQLMGFEIIDDHMYVEALEPMSMGLRIMAHHDLTYATITEKTYDCFEVMEDFIGIFDGWELSPTEDIKEWV
ncbi:DUF695 domain-containing protein [Peptococcus simiae]|uniref:DUF695 domain-containing protein n=1 Tax=Peptococcus simiae TaxID=1643805 RepID=A0ABW9GYY0_9FIRM